ncbi:MULTISPECIES: hypothetical protein [unclassified Duganella]|uniref:hypothetical protein n=1 Tax=unclassified Duganella TaxID=2636909 RepID=UPI0006F4AEA0|nr:MULTISPECIES: hypothetical protein [unclassified Duganella]KQV45922.1 hypothetical protein ASD07_15625 [Duganella sp. Root336D2]KRB81590.1 hypothetical protein ASE26_14685 [Duganella sp. Root198D2]
MKNNIFDISFGFTLALPLSIIAGAIALAADNGSGSLALLATVCTLILAWALLAQLCMDRRHGPGKREFRHYLVGALLLLPLAATGAMFGMIKLPQAGYAGGIYWLLMSILAAATIFLGWLAAAVASAFD